jgi:hypothetical protein
LNYTRRDRFGCDNRIVRRLLAIAGLFVSAPLLFAEDKWIYVRSGPFEVWTNGPEKPAKLRLAEAEQFRHVLTGILGKTELKSPWPIRILALKDKRATSKPLTRVRDAYIAVMPNEQPLDANFRRAAARIFLDANTKRYPSNIDRGLEQLLAPLDVNGAHVSLGAPPADQRTPDWARIHLLVTDPAYSGRMRVYLSNLEQGGEEATACRNAFEKTLSDFNNAVAAHTAKGSYEWKLLSSRPINPDRDYYAKSLPSEQARIAEVDAGMFKAVSLADLQTAESFEAQGLFAKAVEADSKSPNAWLQYGLELIAKKDKVQALAAFKKAAELNLEWGAPLAEMARMETTPARAMFYWKQAATREVRNVEYWKAYAVSATEGNQFSDAAKAWAGAERAAGSEDERKQLIQARRDLETQRADFAESERRKAAEEREREIARLKAEALGEIRKAEMKANERLGPGPERATTTEKWWDGPKGEKLDGQLTRVDCLPGGLAKLHIAQAAGKPAKILLVREPSKIVIVNNSLTNNEATLGCGIQKPPRDVAVEFTPKPDAKYGSAGDVIQVQFK